MFKKRIIAIVPSIEDDLTIDTLDTVFVLEVVEPAFSQVHWVDGGRPAADLEASEPLLPIPHEGEEVILVESVTLDLSHIPEVDLVNHFTRVIYRDPRHLSEDRGDNDIWSARAVRLMGW